MKSVTEYIKENSFEDFLDRVYEGAKLTAEDWDDEFVYWDNETWRDEYDDKCDFNIFEGFGEIYFFENENGTSFEERLCNLRRELDSIINNYLERKHDK